MYCNNCGKPCKSEHKFCSHCGFGIDSTMVAAATAVVVPSGSNSINTTTNTTAVRTPSTTFAIWRLQGNEVPLTLLLKKRRMINKIVTRQQFMHQ